MTNLKTKEMKIIEFGIRAFLAANEWSNEENCNVYLKGDRSITVEESFSRIILKQNDEYLLTSYFNTFDSGLVRFFIRT